MQTDLIHTQSPQALWPAERLWVLEFYYCRISKVKQCKLLRGSQSRNLNIFEFFGVSPGDQQLAKEPEDSGYDIGGDVMRNSSLEVGKGGGGGGWSWVKIVR